MKTRELDYCPECEELHPADTLEACPNCGKAMCPCCIQNHDCISQENSEASK